MNNNKMRKGIAGFELLTMIIATFAFAYIINIPDSQNTNQNLIEGGFIKNILSSILKVLNKPLMPLASAAISQPTVCCEKTTNGAFCINTNESSCDTNFKISATSCESTGYCKLGTCYDSKEGICMENTPQRVCEGDGKTWSASEIEDVPQCQLGCCIISDQAAFVSLVRCKKLASQYGIAIDYKTDITNELDCVAEAQSQDTGACVYEKDFERTCEFTTRKQCGASDGVEVVNGTSTNITMTSEKKFYKDYLCSSEELNTICARQATTKCSQGEVYWYDSCGNKENVYSSDKDKSWNYGKVLDENSVCTSNDGSDVNCGNCDFQLGTRCALWEGVLGIGKPSFGNYFCQKTTCTDKNGNERKNGESWCVSDSAVGSEVEPAGSRSYREVCVDGIVKIEPCADFRNELCIQDSIATDNGGEFSTAACRVNRWQDCLANTKQDDCENSDQRDCQWLSPVTGMMVGTGTSTSGTFSNPTADQTFSNPTATGNAIAPITGNSLFGSDEESTEDNTTTNRPDGICVPQFSPGFDFWNNGDGAGICGQANAKCVVTFEKGLLSKEKCTENCECLESTWATQANNVCNSLGDCGGKVNINSQYTDDGYEWKIDDEEQKIPSQSVSVIMATFTGQSFLALINFAVLSLVSGADMPADMGLNQAYTAEQNAKAAELNDAAQNSKKPGVTGALTLASISKAAVKSGQTLTATLPEALTISGTDASGKVISETIKTISKNADGTSNIGSFKNVKDLSGITGAENLDLSSLTFKGATSTNFFSKFLGLEAGGMGDAIVTGLAWGIGGYLLGKIGGGFLGLDDNNSNALGLSLGVGAALWQGLGVLEIPGAFWWGLGAAALIFVLLYKDVSYKVVTYSCLPWQAPVGGNDCNKCNNDKTPCSEYRCKSLGQNCDVVNPGTEEEKCVNVNPRDVTPPIISPDEEEVTDGYGYSNVQTSPPSAGFKIIKQSSTSQCIQAFTPIKFGIKTDEPAQCKVDVESTESFDAMSSWFGGSNLYLNNHVENLVLPDTEDLKNGSIALTNGNTLNLFVRCQDKNGNENSAEYNINLCVEEGPDNTAPQIKATSVLNGKCISSDKDSTAVEFYINEPSECKWGRTDRDYDLLETSMNCSTQAKQISSQLLYTCKAELNGISKAETNFYIRCKDQPGKADNLRNQNEESYVFSLRSSQPLKMTNLQPTETILGAANPWPITLSATTLYGCNDGKAVCYYSTTGEDSSYIAFADTDNEDGINTQRQDLTEGTKKYYIKCTDEGGNTVINSTTFDVEIDTEAPAVARAYEENNMLKIITVRDSECSYTYDDCDFTFDEGTLMAYSNTTSHVTEWKKDKTYYIKCRDSYRAEPADCSIILRPSDKLF